MRVLALDPLDFTPNRICNEIATNYGASRHVPGELLKDIAFEYIEELPADNVLVKLGYFQLRFLIL